MAAIKVQHLVGKLVASENGERVGHIEAIRAEQQGDDFVITEYHVGAYAALERLSASIIGAALLDLFRLRREKRGYRIPWDRLDISDVEHPRLRGSKQDLPELRSGEQQG
jgi:sporulation protein YlmC with PRC-barrel domain